MHGSVTHPGNARKCTGRAPCMTSVESFMREPMWDYEHLCVMGANCECNFIGMRAGEGFTAVEFILQSEACIESAQRPRQMCVLCHQRLIQSLFYDIMYAGGFFDVFFHGCCRLSLRSPNFERTADSVRRPRARTLLLPLLPLLLLLALAHTPSQCTC